MIRLLRFGTIGSFMARCEWVTNIKRMGMLKVISLALLFLIRLRFPLDKSITYVLRSRYGNLMVKELWKFEKVDYSLQKCKLDLTFLTHLQRHFIFKNWYCFWCLSGDLNKVSGKDQKKKECYDNISLDHTYKQIKQWQSLLWSSKNKTALIKFLGEQWMANDYSTLLHNKSIYILLQNDCFKYQDGIWQTVNTLTCCHEDADTWMLLHGKHMRDHGAAKVVLHTPDIDVFILLLCSLGEIR